MSDLDAGYDFTGLTQAQEWLICLQGWRVGSKYPDGSPWPQPNKRTVKKLIDRGLIVERKVDVPVRGGFVMVTEYDVPLAVHLAYCMSQ